MIFLPGSLEAEHTIYTDKPSAVLNRFLLPSAEQRYVHGPFGYYLSQAIKTPELTFNLHHFFVRAGTRFFPRSETTITTLHHLLKGTVDCELYGGVKVTVSDRVSHFFYLPGGVEHRADFNGEPVISAHFDYHPRFIADAITQYPVLREIMEHSDGEGLHELSVTHSYLEQYLWNNLSESLRQELAPVAFLIEKGRELLRLYCQGLSRLKEQQEIPGDVLIPRRDLELARAVKTMIETDLRIHYTVTELAHATGWNNYRLKQVFPQVYGMTPYKYLVKCRMEFGKHLLLSTRDLLSTIAFACGYKEEHHFIKLFKKTYGITPGKMRERDS